MKPYTVHASLKYPWLTQMSKTNKNWIKRARGPPPTITSIYSHKLASEKMKTSLWYPPIGERKETSHKIIRGFMKKSNSNKSHCCKFQSRWWKTLKSLRSSQDRQPNGSQNNSRTSIQILWMQRPWAYWRIRSSKNLTSWLPKGTLMNNKNR